MNTIQPPIGPGQLPPHTDDFTFCTVSNLPLDHADFQATGPGGVSVAHIDPQPPHTTAQAHGNMAVDAVHVICDAGVGGNPFHYEYDETPPGWYVAKMICGVQDGQAGGLIPWGLVILSDHGAGIQVVALGSADDVMKAQ